MQTTDDIQCISFNKLLNTKTTLCIDHRYVSYDIKV